MTDLVNLLLAPFGRRRVLLGHWPHAHIVATAITTIRELGGLDWDQTGTPAGEVENIYFHFRGRRVCLCIADYTEVSLWGPTNIVVELSHAMNERMKHRSAE